MLINGNINYYIHFKGLKKFRDVSSMIDENLIEKTTGDFQKYQWSCINDKHTIKYIVVFFIIIVVVA